MIRLFALLIAALLVAPALSFAQDDKADDSWKVFRKNSKKNKHAEPIELVEDTVAAEQPEDSVEETGSTVILPVEDGAGPGIVEVVQDYRIRELMDRQVMINDSIGKIKGYRVQIYFNSGAGSRTQAREVEAEFLKLHPDIPSYVLFDNPHHKTRVGDFRTRLAAEKLRRELLEGFPAAFVVKDWIELPKLED